MERTGSASSEGEQPAELDPEHDALPDPESVAEH
jgi:hypothetical protein